jgi:hypothetical protein
MPATNGRLVLSAMLQRLNQTYGVNVPYSRLWNAAVQGRIPVERDGGRWTGNEADIPKIAEALGISTAPAAA